MAVGKGNPEKPKRIKIYPAHQLASHAELLAETPREEPSRAGKLERAREACWFPVEVKLDASHLSQQLKLLGLHNEVIKALIYGLDGVRNNADLNLGDVAVPIHEVFLWANAATKLRASSNSAYGSRQLESDAYRLSLYSSTRAADEDFHLSVRELRSMTSLVAQIKGRFGLRSDDEAFVKIGSILLDLSGTQGIESGSTLRFELITQFTRAGEEFPNTRTMGREQGPAQDARSLDALVRTLERRTAFTLNEVLTELGKFLVEAATTYGDRSDGPAKRLTSEFNLPKTSERKRITYRDVLMLVVSPLATDGRTPDLQLDEFDAAVDALVQIAKAEPVETAEVGRPAMVSPTQVGELGRSLFR